ncbi:ABC-type transport auxiliary lipoprotein family protein [Notoacmeibacter sp. MSK16QG-6]|uniref:ABC-type transport auxiliary lipoprotein family protein n=1 Tax=Notoacmeibacter sp. MSK16QG-6 TaxID=2957982 RepID=UPI00209DF34D
MKNSHPKIGIFGAAVAMRFRLLILAALVALVPGCALVGGGSPELDTFGLTAPDPETRRSTRRQILLPEPSAVKALDGQNIVVMTSPTMVTYLEGAQWSDRLPLLVQSKLLQSFEMAGIAGVGTPGEGLAIDYQLITDIRAFEIRASGPESAYVEISVRLLNDRNGQVIRQAAFDAEVAVVGSGSDAYANTLNLAFEDVAKRIVSWALGLI